MQNDAQLPNRIQDQLPQHHRNPPMRRGVSRPHTIQGGLHHLQTLQGPTQITIPRNSRTVQRMGQHTPNHLRLQGRRHIRHLGTTIPGQQHVLQMDDRPGKRNRSLRPQVRPTPQVNYLLRGLIYNGLCNPLGKYTTNSHTRRKP